MTPDPPHPAPEELFAYRDGEMTAERRVAVEAHVTGCRICRETIDEVSGLEADLRTRPEDVGERYYERLTESVMKKIAAEDKSPRFERRKPTLAAQVEEEKRAAPRLPWAAVISTASAAAAVLLVVGVLMRQGAIWRTAPRPTLLEKSAPDAGGGTGAVTAESSLALSRARESKSVVAQDKRKEAPSAKLEKLPAQGQVAGGRDQESADLLQKKAEPAPSGKDETERQLASNEKQQPSTAAPPPAASPAALKDAAAPAPTHGIAAVRVPTPEEAANRAATPGETGAYEALIHRYGLPPVWEEGSVSNDALLRAEPGLKNLYRTGGAGSDSANVRLYLAEAMRFQTGAHPDSAAYEEIVHHYQRAIRLGAGTAVASTAMRRLQEYLEETTPSP
jgi:negative regulator of sigma E activity